jgi:hypothetical protein
MLDTAIGSELEEDSFNQNFNQIDSTITKKYPKEILDLLLGMFPAAKEAIINQYNDEDGMPFSEWRRAIYEIDNFVLSGPIVVNGSNLPIHPELEADRLAKYQQYIKDKDSGKPAQYFRANDSDPRTIDFTKLPPITLFQGPNGLEVTDGNHRAFLAKMANKPLRAYVWKRQPNNHPNVAKIKALFSTQQGVAETRMVNPKRIDIFYRPDPRSRGRRVVAKNVPTTALDALLKKLSDKFGVRDTDFEWSAADHQVSEDYVEEKWSQKYKKSINCAHPKGFSQKAHCAGRKK